MKNKKPVFFIIVIVACIMAYIAFNGLSIPLGAQELILHGAQDLRYGIDIRGGVDAVYEAADMDRKPTGEELDAARTIIETRLDQQNILDYDVTIDKQNGYLLVRFPWKSGETSFNPEKAIAELGETAKLTFRDEQGNVLLDGSHVKKSTVATNPELGGYVVSLSFDEEGTRLFSEATGRLVGQPIIIYMDEISIQAAKVIERITHGSAYIDGMSGFKEAKELSDKINAGALPFSMITKNHSTISPTLGRGALDVMVLAGTITFGLICFLLILYYRIPGFVACIALATQISGQILALSIPQITLTLTGIAGIILSIGMGVDANVIVSERISEEIKSGRTLSSAISCGFHNAFASVFDGNITVLIVAVILMAWGSGSLLSFAYTLLTGIFFNFIAGVTASRLMISSLSEYGPLRRPEFYTCPSRRVVLCE